VPPLSFVRSWRSKIRYMSCIQKFNAFLSLPLSGWLRIVAVVAGFIWLFLRYCHFVQYEWDYAVYYLASQAIWSGKNAYDPQVLLELEKQVLFLGYGGLPFLYSPFFARLLYPLAMVPFILSAFLWLVIKCMVLEGVIWSCIYLLRIPFNLFWVLILHLAAMYFRPFALDLAAGNVAILESALVLFSFCAWRAGRETASAIFLWSSALIKGFPLLLCLYPVHLRDWRWIRSFAVVTGCVFVLVGLDFDAFQSLGEFYQSPVWQKMWDEQVQSFYNCSSTTVILRTFSDTYFAEPLIDLPRLVVILVPLFPILILLLTAYTVKTAQIRDGFKVTDPLILSHLLCCLLLLSPRLAGYTLSWVFFPMIASFLSAIQRKMVVSFLCSLSGIILLQVVVPPEHVSHGLMQFLIDKEFFGLLFFYFSTVNLIYFVKDKGIMINK
jgi:hypothetical protein